MRIECSCGFAGALRPIEVLDKQVGKCYGCDRLYEYRNGRVEPMPDKVPDFKSYEDMQKFLDKLEGGTTKATSTGSTGKPKRKKKTKPAEADSSKTLEHAEPSVPVYKTLHMYLRPGDSWEQLLRAGRDEVGYMGPGSLVFVHNHSHKSECNDSCRETS